MFHSVAGHAEYVASLAQALAELVEFEVEQVKFSTLEMSQSGTHTQASELKAGLAVSGAGRQACRQAGR